MEDFATGRATGLAMPTHPEALQEAGAAFLTRAFHAFGSLPADNAVARIVAAEPCHAGNSGQKLLLSVEYARPDPALHTGLFVKLSRDFADAFRDRRRHELEAEVRLAELARLPAFPVAVAKPYFADFDPASGSGLLITQQIAFGEGGLEPLRAKCRDHELPNALEHYQATVTALAALAAAQHRGALSPELERLFPWDEAAAAADLPIPQEPAQIRARVAAIGALVQGSPQLFPPAVRAPGFIERLERDALAFQRHEAAVRRFLHADPRFVALTHWNTNIDNAWFWRDAAGVLRCGLLDWGMARQMNLAYGLWGGLSAAEGAMLEADLDDLLDLFARELAARGGPELPRDRLDLHFDLSVAMLGLALMLEFPALLTARLPEAASASGPRDPLIDRDPVVRGFLHVSTNFLDLWARRDFGASLDAMRSLV
ncbi:hypothetical protein [Novosphingobium sp. JCM 18896]|uniref:hypothetical protein n=1 Tax=Novosphingobium sp. JCM 18896 TaxID=2989731 RepID=UPI0022239596|nr:hypothetical protein [Novosphingobium sp. JCM 18896]MCW1431273.1 hypothetical protein [Novosphingobium sp. JCM 18896]